MVIDLLEQKKRTVVSWCGIPLCTLWIPFINKETAGYLGGRGKQISRLTWSTQWGLEQWGLHKDILPQTNKQQKDCSKSLILICYTAMNNHTPMYPVPFWALLSLTAWSLVLQPRITWYLRVTLSLCLLRVQDTPHLSSTPVSAQCFLMSTEVYSVVSGSLSF